MVAERRDGGAGLQHLKNLAAERLGQIAEFQLGAAAGGFAEVTARGPVGVQDGQVAAHHHAGAAQLAEDVRHQFMIGGELVVQPDVLDGQPEFLEQMENDFQLAIEQRFAR